MVFEDDPDVIALVTWMVGPGALPLNPQASMVLSGGSFALVFGDEMEDLGGSVHGVGQIADVRGHDRDG